MLPGQNEDHGDSVTEGYCINYDFGGIRHEGLKDIVFNLSKLNSLAANLDLEILPANEV